MTASKRNLGQRRAVAPQRDLPLVAQRAADIDIGDELGKADGLAGFHRQPVGFRHGEQVPDIFAILAGKDAQLRQPVGTLRRAHALPVGDRDPDIGPFRHGEAGGQVAPVGFQVGRREIGHDMRTWRYRLASS